jgi:hypothetical protein
VVEIPMVINFHLVLQFLFFQFLKRLKIKVEMAAQQGGK